MHEGSTFLDWSSWQSMSPPVLLWHALMKRFQAEQCNKEGFGKARVCQIILTVKDPQAGSTQPRAWTILNFASETKEFVVKEAETFDLKLSKAQRSTIAFEHVWNKGHGRNGWVGGFASPFGLYLWFDYLSGAADVPSKHMKINTDLGVLLSPTRPCLETSLARSRSHSQVVQTECRPSP